MTKRKLMIFFLIAAAVFVASRGEQVRHANASIAAQPHAQAALQR